MEEKALTSEESRPISFKIVATFSLIFIFFLIIIAALYFRAIIKFGFLFISHPDFPTSGAKQPKLLDLVRIVTQAKHNSLRTENLSQFYLKQLKANSFTETCLIDRNVFILGDGL